MTKAVRKALYLENRADIIDESVTVHGQTVPVECMMAAVGEPMHSPLMNLRAP
jgi:hypothetical protein